VYQYFVDNMKQTMNSEIAGLSLAVNFSAIAASEID